MTTTVTFKLNKPAHQFQAGESTGFGIRGGVQYYDRETKQKEWTNYEAVIFAKAPAQIQFYQQALVEGSIVEVSGKQEKIRQFQGNNGLSLSIELIDAYLGHIGTVSQNQGNVSAAMNQQPQQQPQQFNQPTGGPAPRPPAGGFDDFDNDLSY